MTMSKCQFCVVLCSHNGCEFIEEQIHSILDQGESVGIIHVHDFASTDATRTLLEDLKSKSGTRLTVSYHSDAPGAAASFIRALRETEPLLAEGQSVFLADQDDIWLPNKLATIKEHLSKRELSPNSPFVLFHDVQVVDDSLRELRPTYYTGNPFRVPRDLHPVRLLMANPAIGHTMLLSTPLVGKLTTWPDIEQYLMHDWLSILIASRFGRIEHIPIALSLYRQHDSNILGAYRTGKKLVSLSRLFSFVDRMINQAVYFTRTTRNSQKQIQGSKIGSSPVDALCRRGYRSAAIALSVGSLIYGPTWQRKLIALLLFVRAFLGPIGKGSSK